jgi:hypothetical protein
MGAWTGLKWHRIGTGCGLFVNKGINIRVPSKAENFWTRIGIISLSKRTLLQAVEVYSSHSVTIS